MKSFPIITISLIAGFIIGVLGTTAYKNNDFSYHIKQEIFDECFRYHAEKDKDTGISARTVSMCIDKASIWQKELEK